MLFGALVHVVFAVGCILVGEPFLGLPSLGFAALIIGHFFEQELHRAR